MADYWKSVPKRLCPICNVWMYDNRPSIDRHERSSKHKEKLEKKMERAMRPKRNDEKITKIQDQLDPTAHLTNSAFKIDGVNLVESNNQFNVKKIKKFKIDFGEKNQLTNYNNGNIAELISVKKDKIQEPAIVNSHPILGEWQTVRMVEIPSSEGNNNTNNNELIHDCNETEAEQPISEFQVRINIKSKDNKIDAPVIFKKNTRKRSSILRKPINE